MDQLIAQVKNPGNQKTLAEEGRIIHFGVKDQVLSLTYLSHGLDFEKKSQIEDQVTELFKDQGLKEIKVIPQSRKTVGEAKKEPKAAPKAQPAPLKTGHATPAPRKRIPGIKHVLAVSSCKGGVGKSTVSVNLAFALLNEGHKVGLIDADIYGPSIPTLLGAEGARPQASEDKKIKPLEAHGLKFISFGPFVPQDEAVIWRGPMLGGVLNQFFFDTQWGELDYLIIDLPPGTGDIQLSMVQATAVDGAVIVSTPQKVALNDTRKGMGMFEKLKVPIVGLVENMSFFVPEDLPSKRYYIFGQDGVKNLSKELNHSFLAELPLMTELRESADKGRPYLSNPNHKESALYKNYTELANKVNQFFSPADKTNEKGGFFSRLFS